MKRFLFVALYFVISITASAQTTRIIKGAVIDKNGNPIPGATVEATGGAESTMVDADGTFSMEVPVWLKTVTVKYAGMRPQKVKTNVDNIICEMKPKDNRQWFVNALGGFSTDSYKEIEYEEIGVMFGNIGEWGFYSKFLWVMTNRGGDREIPTITAGVTKRMCTFMHIYTGAGYGKIQESADDSNLNTFDALAFDLGFIIKPTRHISLNIGTTLRAKIDDYTSWSLSVGIGYAF